MDMSAFPDEKEVLIYDGTRFEVISIENTTKPNGDTLIIIVLKVEGYLNWEQQQCKLLLIT